jgi:hypothetical protein
VLRDLAVLHGDTIHPARKTKRHVGHIEQAIVHAAEALERLGAVFAEHGVHLVHAELVVPCGNRRVGREDALLCDDEAVFFGCGVQAAVGRFGPVGYLVLEQVQGQQGGMAFIHMVDSGQTTQVVQKFRAGKAQDGFLAETIVRVASVKMIGQMAVVGIVAFDVGIEQKDRNDMAFAANDVEAPGLNFDISVLDVDRNCGFGRGKPILRAPGNIGFSLLALRVQMLAEVAAAMHKGNGSHRRTRIRGRTQRIAGQHAQAAGVGRDGGIERDFHGKVTNGTGGKIEGSRSLGSRHEEQILFPAEKHCGYIGCLGFD